MLKKAIVVGASSGIGAATVRRLAAEGYKVVAIARRQEALDELAADCNDAVGAERVWAFSHDVTRTEQAREVFDKAVQTLDGLDAIIYSAGVMPECGEFEWNVESDRKVMEVNVIGAVAWLDLAGERFQIQRAGTIVGIGSVAGDRGRRGRPAYCASKAALHSFLEGLRNKLSRYGVQVVTIKPGPVRTPLTAHLEKLPPLPVEAEDVADSIFRAIANNSSVVYKHPLYFPIMTIVKNVPSVIFRRMNF